MWALVRRTAQRDPWVVGPALAAVLLGIPLTAYWLLTSPGQHHLAIIWQYVSNGIEIVLMYKLRVDGEDLWKRKRKKIREADTRLHDTIRSGAARRGVAR